MRWNSLIFLLLAATAHSATYYTATNGNDAADGSLATPWLSLNTSTKRLTAGDVLYIFGGQYNANSNHWISPTNSGTAANPIIVSNYPGQEVVIFDRSTLPEALGLDGMAWWKIYGLTFSNNSRGVSLDACTNCTLGYLTVRDLWHPNVAANGLVWITGSSQSNRIHNCTLRGGLMYPPTTPISSEAGFGLVIGYYNQTNGPYWDYYNLIESNHIFYGGHDVVTMASGYCILKDNLVHNEGWYNYCGITNQLVGNRCVEIGASEPDRDHNVVIGNRISRAGWPQDNGGAGITTESRYSIIRNNTIFNTANYGIQFYTKWYSQCNSNYFFLNTLAYNGIGENGFVDWQTNYSYGNCYYTNTQAIDSRAYHANLYFYQTTNNVIKNNVMWRGGGNTWAGIPTNAIYWIAGDSTEWAGNYTNNADLRFYNETATDPTSTAQPDFRIASDSVLVDQGVWLTTATSNGSGTSLPVADAGYFFDGYGMTTGDTIQLQGQTATAVVTLVDRATKTLTLATPLTWTNGQGVALAYSGSAPDIGAFEYTANPSTTNYFGTVNINTLVIEP